VSTAISADLTPGTLAGTDVKGTGASTVTPEDRGRLDVADRVVEKVAGHAVTLVPQATAAPRRVLGVNVGKAREESRADVDTQVHGDVATVQARIAVQWPRSVAQVADAVRGRISEEVSRITGVRVDHVDLEVTAMTTASPTQPRVR